MSLGSPRLREAPGFRPVALSAVPGFFRLRVPPSRPSPSPVPVVTGFGQELGVATGCMFVVGFFFSFLFFFWLCGPLPFYCFCVFPATPNG